MATHQLYRCLTPTDRLCPCGKAARSLKAAGVAFDTKRVGISHKPEKREEIMELTGQPRVPVWVEPDGTATYACAAIAERVEGRAGRHP
ncbi:MAG: glutaredoxin family protein [Solirubrobacteraceae bacterium]